MNQLLYLAQNFDAYEYDTVTEVDAAGAGLLFGFFGLFWLVLIVPAIIGMWKVFEKAGKPGWAAIVPIYNFIVLLEIVGRPMWWIALLLVGFVPFFGALVAIVVSVILAIDLAKSFGKDTGFGILMVLVPFVGYPMLGFGDAQYQGPVAATAGGGMPVQSTGQGVPQAPTQQQQTPDAPQPVQAEPPTDNQQQ